MKEALPKLKLKTLKASPSATSSPESAAGLSPCNLPESTTERHSGQEARRASRSVLPENSSDSSTRGTSRPSSSTSSVSAALQSSLGNRLRQQLQNRGCAIYKLTWKEKITPSGLPYSQLVASAHRTKETGYFSERTTWPTPRASEHAGGGSIQVAMKYLAGEKRPSGQQMSVALRDIVMLAAWPTPTTRDHKDGKECLNVPTNSLLGREVWKVSITQPIRITASGHMLTGSDAAMESSGQLNPAHSRWLMGFPPEWDDCAVTAMQSYQKSLPNSSVLSWRPLTMRLRAKK